MANKALNTRQKKMIRNEPARSKTMKPRNPVAQLAKQRAAGPHEKTSSALRQLQQRLLKKLENTD